LTWAFVAGGGILLIILALGLNAVLGTSNSDSSGTFTSMMIMGGLLLVGGTVCWMIQLRPWRKFDDFSIPLYTGHHDTHAAHVETAEIHETAHEPLTPPVMIDPMAVFSPEVVEGAGIATHGLVTTSAHPDNFERIRGIGPKIASALIGAGIFTFAELAQRNPTELEAIVHGASVRLVGSAATWPTQAQFAAKADWDGLARYQAEQIDHSE
jgi:predicted flap endonuclease-1-like 5' DNA nuclease